MTEPKTMEPVRAWAGLSSSGHFSSTVGYAFTRKALREQYRLRFGHDLERAGYRAVRVTIQRTR